jgi:large subunit ribosomal protein L19
MSINAIEIIRSIEADYLKDKKTLPTIHVGDTIKVGVRIQEGGKERIQPYEGTVIAMRNGGINETITVRKVFQGVGVERVFLLHSPLVADITIIRRGKVRRAKLYYLRDRVGKATRIKQRFDRPIDKITTTKTTKTKKTKAN